MDFKEEIIKSLKKEIKQEITLEIPPDNNLGDFAFPCFSLAKIYKKNPNEISLELSKKIKSKYFSVVANGSYLNFFLNKEIFSELTLKDILKEKKINYGKNKTIAIDMSSPNIAKPFGIGHLRSTIIGNSLANIFSELGYKIIKINYLGDWGTQFGKIIAGYKKFGNEKELKKDPINHLLDIYVKANKEEYEDEARLWFKRLEQGDKEALKLWKKFRDLSLIEFNKIYKTLNIKFDFISGESLYNKKTKEVVNVLNKKNLIKESDGALIINLEKYDLGVCLIQKKDDTTLYSTRDMAAAIDRYKKYKFSKMIYEVGSEQKLHFKQVFKVLELIGYDWAKNCVHVDHGLYLGKDGKKFATRKGKTVFMKDVINETIELAKQIIEKKNPKLKNKEEIARKIAVSAIFYGDLKNNRINDIIFDIEKFLDFEGDTGPYLLYSYVRANSILKKANKANKFKIKNISEKEFLLIKKLSQFNDVLINSSEHMSPSILANYIFDLAQLFNEFYHSSQVIGSEKEDFLINLVLAFKNTIGKCLNLLGIETIEKM